MLKQIWDMSKHVSFVFHQKSACQEVKPVKEEEEDEREEDDDYKDDEDADSDYSH